VSTEQPRAQRATQTLLLELVDGVGRGDQAAR
jgi:hypothetical protein